MYLPCMKHLNKIILIGLLCVNPYCEAVTMQQFKQSLEMMRNGCQPKHNVPVELLDKLRAGEFTMGNKELMCYTKCVAQLAGTLTKKGEFSIQKAKAQIPIILPSELQTAAIAALNACAEVQSQYKDPCERVFFMTKCVADYDRENFLFP